MAVTSEMTATRDAGLARLEAYLPRAARYGKERNYDTTDHENVSCLSPYLRHRLVTEQEVLARVLDQYSFHAVDKFVQEVCWRTYWKGWLQMRPAVWRDYRQWVARDAEQLDRAAEGRYAAAVAGETDIACFNHWARELVETGYLHNHARMWFASIWIFTLQLPWSLGADFFFRHLRDGDPASNTLGWRWVAGIQTPGKHYVARASNIEKFTGGRFNPGGQLNESPAPLQEDIGYERQPVPPADTINHGARTGLLLTGEDLVPEVGLPRTVPPVAVAAGWDQRLAGRYQFAGAVETFKRDAIDDGLARAAAHFSVDATELDSTGWEEAVVAWAEAHDLAQVLVPEPALGPWQEIIDELSPALSERGIAVARVRRAWDDTLWPYATRGFFQFRKHIKPSLELLLP